MRVWQRVLERLRLVMRGRPGARAAGSAADDALDASVDAYRRQVAEVLVDHRRVLAEAERALAESAHWRGRARRRIVARARDESARPEGG